jgi:hypothetical protein
MGFLVKKKPNYYKSVITSQDKFLTIFWVACKEKTAPALQGKSVWDLDLVSRNCVPFAKRALGPKQFNHWRIRMKHSSGECFAILI